MLGKTAIDSATLNAIGSAGLDAMRWNPGLTSSLLGAILGAAVSGEGFRTAGALSGAAGGFGLGLTGAGLKGGLSRRGVPPEQLMALISDNPDLHQHIGGALGGVLTGALIQPTPVPLVFNRREDDTTPVTRFSDLANIARSDFSEGLGSTSVQ